MIYDTKCCGELESDRLQVGFLQKHGICGEMQISFTSYELLSISFFFDVVWDACKVLQMRERLRLDGYTFDNCDSGLLPDNLYITRYFNGNGDDLEEGRIMYASLFSYFVDY